MGQEPDAPLRPVAPTHWQPVCPAGSQCNLSHNPLHLHLSLAHSPTHAPTTQVPIAQPPPIRPPAPPPPPPPITDWTLPEVAETVVEPMSSPRQSGGACGGTGGSAAAEANEQPDADASSGGGGGGGDGGSGGNTADDGLAAEVGGGGSGGGGGGIAPNVKFRTLTVPPGPLGAKMIAGELTNRPDLARRNKFDSGLVVALLDENGLLRNCGIPFMSHLVLLNGHNVTFWPVRDPDPIP